MKNYYPRIKEMRKKHNLTQREIADYLDIRQNRYCQYECGKRSVPVSIIIKLAKLYNVPTDYLAGITDETKIH